MITVVTSFGPEGYELYGRQFVSTFREFWGDARLICAYEGGNPGVDGFNLLRTEPCAGFLGRHKGNLVLSGKVEHGASPWSRIAKKKNYSLRHDAYKFCRKPFAIAHASRQIGDGKIFWVDADVQTNRAVPDSLLHELLPDDCHLCYLARPNYHSECGFVGYNLGLSLTREFIAEFERKYATDSFMSDPEWDDSPQFDLLVKRLKPKCKLIKNSSMAQPFDNSILGRYMTHFKGPRKITRK